MLNKSGLKNIWKKKYEETKNELYESIDSFQCDYTSNDAKEVYEQAREDGYLIL